MCRSVADSEVTKITFEGTRAAGVEYIQHGDRKVLSCEREVILSAGSYNTLKLLLLSGIGPSGDLAGFGILCREDLPVSHDLQDHVIVCSTGSPAESR